MVISVSLPFVKVLQSTGCHLCDILLVLLFHTHLRAQSIQKMKRGACPLSHYTVALEDGRGDSSRCARSYWPWLQICHVNAVDLRAHANSDRRDSLDKPSLSESFCSFFFTIAIVLFE